MSAIVKNKVMRGGILLEFEDLESLCESEKKRGLFAISKGKVELL